MYLDALETTALPFSEQRAGRIVPPCLVTILNLLYYTILYYTILYYTILYYTILYYTVNIPTVQHT